MGRRTLAMAAALAAASLGACKSRTEVSPAKAAPAALSQGIDLGAVVRRVRRSFRPSGAALVSEGRTWRARLDGGALSVVPGGGTAGLVLGSATIGRVGSDPGPSGLPRRERDGAIAIERGTATERLLPADGGLEQSWTFRAPPPGKGELRVRIAASGLAYAGSSGSGLHFADRRTGLGVRFGHATFVDAAGVRTPVEARWRQGEIVLAVPAAAVDGAAYPAVLDPLLSPESGVDVPLLGGAPDAQRTPAVAFDGIRFLVAWVDRRSGEAGEIWAARVTADGTLLDPAGIPVATGDGDRPVLAAAAGGGAFLVAWQELPSEFQPRPFRAARLSGDGTLLDAAPVALGADGDRLGALAATFDGTEFRIAWSSSATFDPIRLSTVRLPVTGPPPGPAMVVRTGQAPVYDYLPAPPPAIACAGETCAVAWAPSGVLQAVPVSRSGVLPGLTVATAGADAPALSFDGAGYLLVWQDDRLGTGRPDVSAVRLDPTGALVGGGTFPLATGGARFTPAVAFDGAHHVVVWEERDAAGSDVLGTRVAPDGTIADAIFLPVAAGPGAQLAPAVAAGPGGALVAFEDTGADLSGDVAAARVGPDGMVLDPTPFLVSRSANRELRPAVAFDGTAWLVVWEDSRASGTRDADVYGARVAADGTVLDPAGFAISDTVAFEGHPAVAGCAGGWRVAWEDHRHGQPDVFAARVDPGGAVLDPAGIPVATGGSPKGPPAVACAGDLALVAWAEPGNGQWVPGRLAAARLLAGGKVLDPDGLALSARTSGEPPAVAAGGDGFAVAWSFLAPSGNGDLVTAFVPAQGAPGEAVLVCGAPSSRGAPSLAFDGGGFQLAFEDARAQPGQLRTARLSPAGAPLDGCGIELAGLAGGLEPRLAFDGTRHLLAFRDGGSGELRGAALAPGGGLLETFSIAPAADGQRAPAAACDGAGRCLVASERDDAALGVPRIRIRTAAFAAPAPRCAGPGDCPSGFCVDGVCCDSACGGGDPTDCIACSVAAGAPVDGTCAPALPGTLCQGGGGQCRQAARCDGASSACPATGSLP
ncbi:MAG TPA: hypothetical protein VML50_06655, partial [Anaeromyxobacter sp.]|nr:hypothetical protein [Anaeromyxobacter sp.]